MGPLWKKLFIYAAQFHNFSGSLIKCHTFGDEICRTISLMHILVPCLVSFEHINGHSHSTSMKFTLKVSPFEEISKNMTSMSFSFTF